MTDPAFMEELKVLKAAVAHAEARATQAQDRADHAASVALGAVESIKHFQSALEAGHSQMGEMLAAQRKMVGVVEMLARATLAPG